MSTSTALTTFPVYDWKEGEKITRPGVYRNVPMDVYHGDCCEGPSLSSSGIRLIESRSLLHYWDQSYLNPNRKPEEIKDHFSLGRAIHHLASGEEGFRKHFVRRPDEFPDWRTKAAKEWRAQAQLDGKTVLTQGDIELLHGMAVQLGRHPTIKAGILQGLIEHSIFWKVWVSFGAGEGMWIWLKSRPDVLPIHSTMIVDLKTTTDASRGKVIKAIGEFGYHIQLGLAYEGLLSTWGLRMTEFVLAFIESKRPHAINITPISPFAIEFGRRQIIRAVRLFAQACHTGEWEGYQDDEVEASLPDWLAKKLAAEAENKTLPKIEDQSQDEPAEVI